MGSHKFDPKKLAKLNAPARLDRLAIERVIEHFGWSGGEAFADLGAGTGLWAEAVLDRLPKSTCYALDINPVFVDWMKEHRRYVAEGRLFPTLMDEAVIPLPDGCLDFLFMISLHHELDAPVALLRDCRRVLKPAGGLFIADWDPDKKQDGVGPPRDHMLSPTATLTHLKDAGFASPTFLDASSIYYCLAAVGSGSAS